MPLHRPGSDHLHSRAFPSGSLFQAFCLALIAWLPVLPLRAQTAWTANPNAPANLPSNAKLKFANNTFLLAWQ